MLVPRVICSNCKTFFLPDRLDNCVIQKTESLDGKEDVMRLFGVARCPDCGAKDLKEMIGLEPIG